MRACGDRRTLLSVEMIVRALRGLRLELTRQRVADVEPVFQYRSNPLRIVANLVRDPLPTCGNRVKGQDGDQRRQRPYAQENEDHVVVARRVDVFSNQRIQRCGH